MMDSYTVVLEKSDNGYARTFPICQAAWRQAIRWKRQRP